MLGNGRYTMYFFKVRVLVKFKRIFDYKWFITLYHACEQGAGRLKAEGGG